MSMPPTPPGGGPVGGPGRRWIIAGVVFAAVAALVVGLLVWQARSADDVGSADDGVDRTVGLLTEKDPVCDDWIRYADELAAQTKAWSEIDQSIPATKWTAQQQEVVELAATAMDSASDRFESLIPKAEHVVLQELIAQTVVYLRAYADRIPDYVESDSLISGTAFNFMESVSYMCSTALRAEDVHGDPVLWASTTPNPSKLEMFVLEADPVCVAFLSLAEEEEVLLSGWIATADSSVPASQWTLEDRALFDSVQAVIDRNVPQFQNIAQSAKGRVVGDLIAAQVAYRQAFTDAIPTYEPPDAELWTVVTSLGGGLAAACGEY